MADDVYTVKVKQDKSSCSVRLAQEPSVRGAMDWDATTREVADKLASVALGDPPKMLCRVNGEIREYLREGVPSGWSPVVTKR